MYSLHVVLYKSFIIVLLLIIMFNTLTKIGNNPYCTNNQVYTSEVNIVRIEILEVCVCVCVCVKLWSELDR